MENARPPLSLRDFVRKLAELRARIEDDPLLGNRRYAAHYLDLAYRLCDDADVDWPTIRVFVKELIDAGAACRAPGAIYAMSDLRAIRELEKELVSARARACSCLEQAKVFTAATQQAVAAESIVDRERKRRSGFVY
jgi:hypothetical protein